MPQPTQNNSFEFSHLAAQVDQFDKPGNPFELAPSMEELLRRVGIVKGWIVEKKLKPEDVPTAERWLQYVEERAGVDAETKKTIQEFRAGMTFSKMNCWHPLGKNTTKPSTGEKLNRDRKLIIRRLSGK